MLSIQFWQSGPLSQKKVSLCPWLRRPASVCLSSTLFKHLLLRNHRANWMQISYGVSIGWGNESLFKRSWSHDQDDRHANIYMVKTVTNLLRNQKADDLKTWCAASGARVLPHLFKCWPWVDRRRPDKMPICVFHSNLNVKNPIIFGSVRIMYAKHFPDTQLCPVSKRICFVYIFDGVWTASDFPYIRAKKEWDSKPVLIISEW